MIKFCSCGNTQSYKDCVICHNINLGNTVLIKKGTIIDDKIIDITKQLPKKLMFIVLDPETSSNEEISDFVLHNMLDIYNEEFLYLNKRYNYILSEEFKLTLIGFFKIKIKNLDVNYLFMLLTNPSVLKKSIDLSIMSFYFSLNMKLSPREIEDVFYSSLLCNLNLCNNSFYDLENENFLTNFKKIYNNSYEIIKDDAALSNNVKRILLNINSSSKGVFVNDSNKEVLKDPTLEIIQLTNELLTYQLNSDITIYSNKYRQIQPAIVIFFKNMKNMKHKVKIQNIQKNIRKKLKELW